MKFLLPLGLLLSGCAGLSAWLSDAGQGAAAGASDVPGAIVEGVSALETGGWAAAAVVTALALVKAGVKGWSAANQASKNRRLSEIAAGVKKANGKR